MRGHIIRLRRPLTEEEYQPSEEIQTKRTFLQRDHYISEHMPSAFKRKEAERPIFLVRYE